MPRVVSRRRFSGSADRIAAPRLVRREHVASKTSTQLDDQLIPSFKRMLPILVYALAILWGLAIFEIEISPLLATLGIGGIAIALAAQPTLSNYFAGTYVISEGEIEPGDFIEIEGGPSGFVEDISWRSTKLRSRFNNLIIIPNSMMSDNMITNYSRPALAMNVIVTGGVSYSSDLQQVEDMLMEVATKIVVDSEHAVTETEPRAGFSVNSATPTSISGSFCKRRTELDRSNSRAS